MSRLATQGRIGGNRQSRHPSPLARLYQAVRGVSHRQAVGVLPERLEARQMLAADVVISEIMHHPAPYDLGAEYIELHNRGNAPANLLDWRISKGVDFTFTADKLGAQATLNPGQYLVVAADVAGFQAKYPSVTNVVGGWTGRLSNSRELLEIQNAAGDVVDSVEYADQGDWAVRERGAYGWNTVGSITYDPGTSKVTVYLPAHGFSSGNMVEMAGAEQSEFNGRFAISSVTSHTFQYTITGTPAGQPTGIVIARKRSTDHGHHGWTWVQLADGAGRSLELINPAMPNDSGQNWASSTVVHGTPGAANSVAAANIAPLISEATQSPIVPKSTEAVTITAKIRDELATGIAAVVYWRVDGASSFTAATMADDGLHNDGLAGDGLWGAIIPPQANNTVVEFYLSARDAASNMRTWPAPALGLDGVTWSQSANLLYQVDDAVYSGSQPLFKIIMTEAERTELADIGDPTGDGISEADSDAQINATFVSIDGTGSQVRYLAGVRNRGKGSRDNQPNNYRLNIPTDRVWKGITALNLNGQYSLEDIIGSAIFRQAGLITQDAVPVQVRVNNTNLAASASQDMFGSYAFVEAENTEFVDNHYPTDSAGNYYRAVSGTHTAQLDYRGDNPDAYRIDHLKNSNTEDDDWTDLLALVRVFDPTLTPTSTPENPNNFLDALNRTIDIDQWLQYFAITSLIGNSETTLGTGYGDDYSLFRGVNDTRFKIVPHDLDTVMGRGDTTPDYTRNLFRAISVPAVSRLLTHPAITPRYYAIVKELSETLFAPSSINALIDNTLASYVPEAARQSMKDFVVRRLNDPGAVLAQIPLALTATTSLTVQNGYPYTTAATASLSGKSNVIRTRSVLVNGQPANWQFSGSQTTGTWSWSASNVALREGLNRILVQALDETGTEFDRVYIDIWRGTAGTTAPATLPAGITTWTAANSPYLVTANLTVPAGSTLMIEPGVSVFFSAGVSMTVNGRLHAEGTAAKPIVFTKNPTGGSWAGFRFANTLEDNRIVHASIQYSDSGSESINANVARLHLDHITWSNHTKQYLDLTSTSFVLSNSILPNVTNTELVHYWESPTSSYRFEYARIDGNWFGTTTGYNDIIDFTGGQRPGPIALFVNNIFSGGPDDAIDMDGTDAHVEGNIFTNFHQDAARESKSHAVSTGTEYGLTSDITVVRNLFYDVDHAILVKDGGFGTIVNNTIVNVYKKISDATTAAINVYEPRSGQWEGSGLYLDGNIFHNVSRLFENSDWTNRPVPIIMNRSVIPADPGGPVVWSGFGNITADPMLTQTLNVTDLFNAFKLRLGSPAIGAGPNGLDIGGLVPAGASISGEPVGVTWQTSATLAVGGPEIYAYKYRINGGPWSSEITHPAKSIASITRSGSTATVNSVGHGLSNGDMVTIWGASPTDYNGNYIIRNVTTDSFQYTVAGSPTSPATGSVFFQQINAALPPIQLSNLANGAYTVQVIAKNSAGQWQSEPTTSKTWTVNTAAGPSVRINEVLAWNVAAISYSGLYPDLIELYNPGTETINLSGMSISDNPDAPRRFVFPEGTTLASGQYLVLHADNATANPGMHLGFSLKLEGEGVYLYDAQAALIDSVTFGYQIEDLSIGRLADGTWGLTRPTFGAANIAVPTSDGKRLKINEWLTDGVLPFADDFIELYNPDAVPAAIGGMYLSDNPNGWATRHQIAPLTFVPASGYFVFTADDEVDQGANHTPFKLSPQQGMIGLFDAALNRIDAVLYLTQKTGVSQGRTPDGRETFAFFSQPSPGVANPAAPEPQTVTLNLVNVNDEWRYNQSQTDLLTAWRGYDYDDTITGWLQGPGPLGYDSDFAAGTFKTALNRGASGARTPTFYFRKHFTLDADPSELLSFQLSTFLDDGAIVYLNGSPIFSLGMPTNTTISYSTYTTANGANGREVNNATWEGPFDLLSVALPLLRRGDNVLAVEVHQSKADSGDVIWGATLQATVRSAPQEPAALRVTEINYNPPGGGTYSSDDYEYIELTNAGNAPLSLLGMRLTAAIDFTFPNITLNPGQHIVVAKNPAAFTQRYGAGMLVVGPYADVLSNAGEQIRLLDSLGVIVQDFSYSDTWYPSTDGDGYSLTILDPTADPSTWSNPTRWQPSEYVLGSPGHAEPTTVEPIVFTEVLNHSHDALPDWIELYNPTAGAVTVGGWYLSDDASNLLKYRIPAGMRIESGKYLVLNQTEHFGAAFALSELGESLYLSAADEAGKLTGYRQLLTLGTAETGVSFGAYRDSTGQVQFVAMSVPTPGEANAYPKVGPVVISEIMYHPTGTGVEFIELQNITGNPVALYDPLNPANTWRFNNGIDFIFPENTVIPAGGFVLLVEGDAALFRSTHNVPASVPIFSFANGTNLSNAGERITLVKPGGPEPDNTIPWITVDSIRYGTAAPWPSGADGFGPSLTRISLTEFGNDPTNWKLGPDGGTPGPQDTSNRLLGTDSADVFYLRLSPDGATLQVFAANPPAGAPIFTMPLNAVDPLTILALGGDDALVLDLANGYPIPAAGFAFDGGEGADRITILNTTSADALDFSNTRLLFGSRSITQSNAEDMVLGSPGDVALGSLTLGGTIHLALPLGDRTLRAGSLVLNDTATLDLADNDLLIATGDLAMIEAYLRSGRNNGLWNGPGLTTSAATIHTTLGVLQKPEGLLVKYTWYGDVNGDGVINLTDYFTIDSGYLNQRSGYAHGDVNLDGEINLNDYFLIDSAYLNQTKVLNSPALGTQAAESKTQAVFATKKLKAPKKRPQRKAIGKAGK